MRSFVVGVGVGSAVMGCVAMFLEITSSASDLFDRCIFLLTLSVFGLLLFKR